MHQNLVSSNKEKSSCLRQRKTFLKIKGKNAAKSTPKVRKQGKHVVTPKLPFLYKRYKKAGNKSKTARFQLIFAVEMAGLELRASSTRSVSEWYFDYFCLLSGAFWFENDANLRSRSHCFHTVQVGRWPKVRSIRILIPKTEPRL